MKVILTDNEFLIENESEYSVCIGKFDGIHKGHRALIEKTVCLAKENGIKSGVVTFISKNEKNNIYDLEQKLCIIEKMGIDTVFVINFTEEIKNTYYKDFINKYLVEYFKAKFVVCGYNFFFGRGREGTASSLLKCPQFKTCVMDRIEDKGLTVSSTNIKEFLKQGKIAEANSMLQRKFALSGCVIRGNKIGRTIDFPTANIVIFNKQCDILRGVYGGYAYVDGKKLKSIINIGVAPTIRTGNTNILEAHIIDFNEDIYNKNITVELVCFIRNERKFKNLSELKEEIKRNIKEAKEYL